jgi:hypothetical protein
LKVQLSDFSVILLSIFLQDDIILFFLFARDGPLLQLFLIPVEFQLDLFNFLIGSEDSDLNIIKSLFVFRDDFIMFLYFILKSSTLSLSDLPHVIFSFSFLIFLVNEAFSVEELLVDISEMLF